MSKALLKNIAKIQSGPFGTQLHKDEYVSDGILMLNAKNIGNGEVLTDSIDYVSTEVCERLPQYVLQEGDILFGRAGSIERHTYIDERYSGCFQGTNCIRIRCNKTDISKYVSYYLWLPTVKQKIENQTSGSVLSYITSDLLKEIEIELPDERKILSITKIISLIDNKILINKRINDNLLNQIQAIYDYWFNQYEFPNAENNPYRLSGGNMTFNTILKRDIPSNWTVGSVAKNTLTKFIKPGIDLFEHKTYLATADVKGSTIFEGTVIDYENRESRANMQPTEYSVWFAKMKNSIKHLYLNPEMKPIIEQTILSTGFCGLQCDENSFEYISSYIASPYFELHKDILAHGATQEAVNNDDLEEIHLLIPDKTILKKYHEATQPIYAKIAKNICENKELTKLRNLLLPLLMNGQAIIED